MSKAHYKRQMHSKAIRKVARSLAKSKFWHAVTKSNARLNARHKPHGVR